MVLRVVGSSPISHPKPSAKKPGAFLFGLECRRCKGSLEFGVWGLKYSLELGAYTLKLMICFCIYTDFLDI